MWPFGKKSTKSVAVEAIAGKTASAKLPYETICTICLERFPPEEVMAEYPVCSDCDSEGMGIFVEKFDDYLTDKDASYFDNMLKGWEAREGFRPEYKALKAKRILALRNLVGGRS